MKKTILILFVLMQISLVLKSQEKIQLYFNSNREVTSKDMAVYVREAAYDLENLTLNGKVTDRDLKGNLIMEGNYLYGKRNGEFTFYQKNGNIESKGEYLNNKRTGEWVYYYLDGQKKQSVFFFDNPMRVDFYVREFYNRKGRNLIKKGTGKWINDSIRIGEPDKSMLVRVTGQFKDSLKTGVWKLIRISDHKILQKEQFIKGAKIVALESIGNQGNSAVNNSSRMNQRLQDELRSGTARKEMVGDVSNLGMDDTSWRALGQNHTNYAGQGIVINDGTSQKIVPGPNRSNNSKASVTGSFMGTIDKFPDQNLAKLIHTEMLIPDKTAFPKNLAGFDKETFFKIVTGNRDQQTE